MSRLDSFIRRLEAQRACLECAGVLIEALPGPVLELGLGNGRTYDHLRERLPTRDIYVFERQVAAHPDCIPPADRLFLGDLFETLIAARATLPPAALAHVDIGDGQAEESRARADRVAPLVAALMAPGAVVVSEATLPVPSWREEALPPGVASGRYRIYRVA